MALFARKLWMPGQTVTFKFLNGSARLISCVFECARQWERFANIKFAKVTRGTAHVRVAFQQGQGSWSLIGTDCTLLPQSQVTMNFGWLTSASTDLDIQTVVLHEVGHALGCIHEHQSPAASIPWNPKAVYAYYSGPPNYWTRAMIDANVLSRYGPGSEITNSVFDPNSIMEYPVDPALTIGGFSIPWNTQLSPTDKAMIGKLYPARDVLHQMASSMILERAASPIV
jgi:hypothetical protein